MNPQVNESSLSIDLTMFATSLVALRENMTYVEFDNMIRDISKANDRGKLEEFFQEVQRMYNEGTDLASCFHFAWFDLINDQGENF